MTDQREAQSHEKVVEKPVQLKGEIVEIERRGIAIEQLQDLIAELVKMATMTLHDMGEENALTTLQTNVNDLLSRLAMNFTNSTYAFSPIDKQKARILVDTLVSHPAQIIKQVLDFYLDLQGRFSEDREEMDNFSNVGKGIDGFLVRNLYKKLMNYAASNDKDELLDACVLIASYKWFVEHLKSPAKERKMILSLCRDVESFMQKNILVSDGDIDMDPIVVACTILSESFDVREAEQKG